jgi:elongation factor 2
MGGDCSMDVQGSSGCVSGAGGRHLEILLDQLTRELAVSGVEFSQLEPRIAYRETITAQSSQVCLVQSRNKRDRAWMTAEPLPSGMADAIDCGTIDVQADYDTRSRQLYTWQVMVSLSRLRACVRSDLSLTAVCHAHS